LIVLAWLLSLAFAVAGPVENYADKLAPLIDPAKLAKLGSRAANPRVQKCVYWLASAQKEKVEPAKAIDVALLSVGMTNGTAAELTKAALLRNLTIAERLGCLAADGMDEMRRGKSPTVRRGRYRGQELSVDHIIPRTVVPELDNVIANLELLPLRLNESKNSKVAQRQRDLARKLNKAGLLSDAGLKIVLQHR